MYGIVYVRKRKMELTRVELNRVRWQLRQTFRLVALVFLLISSHGTELDVCLFVCLLIASTLLNCATVVPC